MFNVFKRALFVGAVALGGILPAAVPAAHAATPPQFVVTMPSSIPVGGAFDMSVSLNTFGAQVTAWQFGFTYDPTVLSIQTGVGTPPNVGTFTSYVANQATPLGASAGNVNFKLTTDGTTTSPGNVQKGGQALSGQPAGTGFTADGTAASTLVTFHFTGQAGQNAITALSFNSLKVTDATATAIAGVTVSPASPSITVGTPPAPKLAINSQTTSAVSGTPTSYNVSFVVDNTAGTAASTAGSATVTVTNATPASASVAVPAIAAGAKSAALTAGPFALSSGQTLSNVSIAFDSAPTVTTAYSYSAYASQGTTNIDGTTAGILKLTPPSDITGFALVPNKTNTATSATPMNVQSNLTSFSVSISGTNDGFLSEYDGAAYVTGGKKLNNRLQVVSTAAPVAGNTVPSAPQSITGTAANYLSGLLSGQDPSTGATFATTFSQFVGFNDPSVVAPHSYHETVTFAAAGTF